MNKISPTPWHIHSHSDIAVDIVDASEITICKMSGKTGCALGSKGKLDGPLFINAMLIIKLVNAYNKKASTE